MLPSGPSKGWMKNNSLVDKTGITLNKVCYKVSWQIICLSNSEQMLTRTTHSSTNLSTSAKMLHLTHFQSYCLSHKD